MKAAYTWLRLYGHWYQLLVVLVVEKTVRLTSKRVCKIQFISEKCDRDPMFNLQIAGLPVDSSKGVTVKRSKHSLTGTK